MPASPEESAARELDERASMLMAAKQRRLAASETGSPPLSSVQPTQRLVWIEAESSTAALAAVGALECMDPDAAAHRITTELWECTAEGALEKWFINGKCEVDVLVTSAAFWTNTLQAAAFVDMLQREHPELLVLWCGLGGSVTQPHR